MHRKRSHWLPVLTLGLLLFASQARAEPCTFQRFQPIAFRTFVLDTLPGLNLTIVPPGFAASSQLPLESTASNLIRMARDEDIIAVMAHGDDLLTGVSKTLIEDGNGLFVMQVTTEPYLCGYATCYETLYQTAKDQYAPFRVTYSPLEGVDYYLYGESVGYTLFVAELQQTMNWLFEVLSSRDPAAYVLIGSPEARLRYRIATDPQLAAYAERISLVGTHPVIHIYGTVPSNAVYGWIIDHALDLGFYQVNPHMVVDTGTTHVRAAPPLYPCVFPGWPTWDGWSTWPGWPDEVYEP